MNKLYPIGTIVRIGNDDNLYMIISRYLLWYQGIL